MSNCYINLCGGIGNQLFQVAAGYAYSERTERNFYIDSSKWRGGQGKNGLLMVENVMISTERI